MYKKDDGQISISAFISPFGQLDPKNRWVNIANLIDWTKYEKRYANQFCEDNGAPALKFRMAMGTLIIKQKTGHSDEEVLEDIVENVYMQFLIGLHEFTTKPPFAASSITNFRKYITAEMINEVNEDMFRAENGRKDGGSSDGGVPEGQAKAPDLSEAEGKPTDNEGEILLDATCAPANIKYPTDINERSAREAGKHDRRAASARIRDGQTAYIPAKSAAGLSSFCQGEETQQTANP